MVSAHLITPNEYLRLSALGRRQGIRHGLPCSAWLSSHGRRVSPDIRAASPAWWQRSWPGRGVSARTAPGDMAWWLGSGAHGPAGWRLPEFSRPGGRAWVRLMGDCRASAALAEAGAGHGDLAAGQRRDQGDDGEYRQRGPQPAESYITVLCGDDIGGLWGTSAWLRAVSGAGQRGRRCRRRVRWRRWA